MRKSIESMNSRFAQSFILLLNAAVFQFRLTASKCFPTIFRRPYPKGMLEDVRKSDSRQNAESTPPQDENIDLCSIWAIEFYTPAHMDDLIKNLEDLGWSNDSSRDPASWLRHREVFQFGQATMYLGPILSHDGSDPYIVDSLRATLPPNVKLAYGELRCYTPSLFAIVLEFVFEKEYSRIIDNVIRQDRESYVTQISTGYRIHGPSSQKAAHIKRIRKQAIKLATDWFSNYLPGLCSAGLLDGEFPTCEFMTLRKLKPFPSRDESDGSYGSYLSSLGLSLGYGSWESTDMPELRFKPSPGNEEFPKHHSILSINEGHWIEQDRRNKNELDKESRIYRMHRRMSGLLGLWAIGLLLQGYARYFRDLKGAAFLKSKRYQSAVKSLEKIGESVSYSVDIAAVTSELLSYVQKKRRLGLEIETFIPRSVGLEYWWKGNLEQLIQRQIGENTNWLLSMDNALRNQLTQYGTMLGMVENIRLQNKINIYTYMILTLTIVLAILTFITVLEKFPWLRTMWNSIADLLQVSGFF